MGPTHGVQPAAKVTPTRKRADIPEGFVLEMKFFLLLQKRKREDPADEEPEKNDQNSADDPDRIPVLGQELPQEGGRGSQGGEEDAETQDKEKRVSSGSIRRSFCLECSWVSSSKDSPVIKAT